MSLFVILFFDKEGDKIVRNIWQTLAQENVSNSMIEKGIAPHLTLGMIPYEKQYNFSDTLELFAKRMSPIPINIPFYGFFPSSSNVIFLGVTMTDVLYTLHREFYSELNDYVDLDSLYTPEFWIPHVTLVDDCHPEKVSAVLQNCQQISLPITIYANRIALVESELINILAEYPI